MSHKIFRSVFVLILVLTRFLTGITPALAAPPVNDNFASPEIIGSLPFSATVDNTEATAEPGEPRLCSTFAFSSVWYSFTPAQNMALRVNLSGSFSGYVDIFVASGPGISGLTSLGCASNGNFTNFQVDVGQTYYLRVDSLGVRGVFQLNLEQVFPPSNDNFANAEPIDSLPFSASVDNTNATTELSEPVGCNLNRSVWYSFTPAENIAVRANMVGSATPGLVSIYRSSGSGFSDLTLLGCAFSENSANFNFSAGVTYYLQVTSNGPPGVLQLNLEQITPPANDNFADAEEIGALPFSASVDNTNASVDPGEPQGCSFPFRTVWYSFIPADDMAVRVTSPSGGVVNIFLASGPTLSDLSSTACASSGSSTNLRVEAGQVYYLRVDSFFQSPGVLQFSLQQIFPPANDNFANAEEISALPFNAVVDNTDATIEPGELFGCALNRNLWYSFTPADDMAIRVTSPSGGAVNIFLASGPTLSDLSFLTCVSSGSSTNLRVEAGQTYYFRIDSFGQAGLLQINLEQIFPPANDDFAGAEAINSLPFTVTADNTNATAETGEPTGCSTFVFRSLWYSFTPSEDMALRASVTGSAVSGTVSIFHAAGPDISDLNFMTCAGIFSPVFFDVQAGETYYVRLDSFGQAGNILLNLAQRISPSNDNFANAQPIDSVPFNASVDLTDASTEPNEPLFCTSMNNTVWYSFTPTETRVVRANTFGSSISSNLNIYKSNGTGFSGLQFLACSGSNTSPSFTAEAGQTYYLQVGQSSFQTGTVNVNLVQTNPPLNDNLADATAVSALPFTATVAITDATNEPGEPQVCIFMPTTAWYAFTATEELKVRVDTQGSTINANVNVYHASGDGFPNLQNLGCSIFSGGATSFLAQAGETYYLQVGGSGEAGTIQLNLAEMPTISGRVTDAVTGTPLPGNAAPNAFVTLQRDCGGGCFEFVNSQYADSDGRFVFDSYYYGAPLPPGNYRLEISASQYLTTQFGPFEFSGTSLDLGDIPLSPPSIIRGRVVDANTGNPVVSTFVTLNRCFSGGCFEFVNSQNTDGNGQFHFNSFYYGAPLPGGTYELLFSDSLHQPARIEIEIGPGEDRDLGDVALTPLPLIGSISGRLVDKVTGQPVSQAFMPALALHRCTNGDCSEFVNSLVPDSLGKFRFDLDFYGNPIPVGTFQIRAYADQYQEYQGNPFAVGEAVNINVGNIRLTSFPVRFSEIQACSEIPAAGGDCAYSVRITNGQPTKLEGLGWSLVSGFLPDTFVGHTSFQARDKQELDLAPGKSKTLQFRFVVPANSSSYGTFICTQLFVGRGNNATFNTVGFRDLFCVVRNASGFAVGSPDSLTGAEQASAMAATGSEIEPNNSCQTAQDLGAVQYPFILNGELDSSQSPDVDFFRFSGTPNQLLTIDLEGQGTGKGTLGNPYLGFLDSNCNLIAANDDGGGFLNSRLEITIPSDGVFVLAATLCCDGGFFGGGNGSYQLSVAPVQLLGSISGTVTDMVTGQPLRGDIAPFAYVSLLYCTEFGCSYVNAGAAGADGRFSFSTDFSGTPLRAGNYRVFVSADQYQFYNTEVFSVGNDEHRDLRKLALTSFPVRFSDVQACNIPSEGDLCEFSVKITNGLSTRLTGQAWSIVRGDGVGSFINFTTFQTDAPLDVSLASGRSTVLRFRFRVREPVADGAVICASVLVGQSPDAQFNTVGHRFLFCVVKGSDGFTLMSEQQMHEQFQQLRIQETEPKKQPTLKK